jgi:hypothetical protein
MMERNMLVMSVAASALLMPCLNFCSAEPEPAPADQSLTIPAQPETPAQPNALLDLEGALHEQPNADQDAHKGILAIRMPTLTIVEQPSSFNWNWAGKLWQLLWPAPAQKLTTTYKDRHNLADHIQGEVRTIAGIKKADSAIHKTIAANVNQKQKRLYLYAGAFWLWQGFRAIDRSSAPFLGAAARLVFHSTVLQKTKVLGLIALTGVTAKWVAPKAITLWQNLWMSAKISSHQKELQTTLKAAKKNTAEFKADVLHRLGDIPDAEIILNRIVRATAAK